jgi:hypothetical protein
VLAQWCLQGFPRPVASAFFVGFRGVPCLRFRRCCRLCLLFVVVVVVVAPCCVCVCVRAGGSSRLPRCGGARCHTNSGYSPPLDANVVFIGRTVGRKQCVYFWVSLARPEWAAASRGRKGNNRNFRALEDRDACGRRPAAANSRTPFSQGDASRRSNATPLLGVWV